MDKNRNTALDILMACERDGAYLNLALKKKLENIKSGRDKRFISALVYGVTEKKLLLDYYISKVSSVKLSKINKVVLTVLRLGLYQVIFLSTPVSAACNSSVELAKNNGQYKSAGFVNAVLRRLAVSYAEIPLPTERESLLSVKYSVSVPVLKTLLNSFGEAECESFLACDGENFKKIYLAVNTVKTTASQLISALSAEGIHAERSLYDGLLETDGGFDIEGSDAYAKGLFHVIGVPSYITARLTGASVGERITDMCAAPGGKTFVMGYMSQNSAKIKAFDLHAHKTDVMRKNTERLGLESIEPVTADSCALNRELIGTSDRVLCDVPCSGLGMIHKKPDIKYKDIDFNSLIKTQKQILENAAMYLKDGGRLVYSTCTVNRNENSEVVGEFLKKNPQFEMDDSVNLYGVCRGEKLFLPHKDNTDGFYVAVMRKKRGVRN